MKKEQEAKMIKLLTPLVKKALNEGAYGFENNLIKKYPKGIKVFDKIIASGDLEEIWEKCLDMISGDYVSPEEQENILEVLEFLAKRL